MLNPIGNKAISQRNIIGEKASSGAVTLGSQNTVNNTALSQLSCQYVALSNYDLNGTETIDGSSPSDGDLILVANQTDKSENGVYSYSTSGDWSRQTGLQGGQLITITEGATKEGTIWIVETTSFSEGTDDIDIVEYVTGVTSQLDSADYTFYVTTGFTEADNYYNDIEDALTDADAVGVNHNIIVLDGTHSGNYDVGGHTLTLMKEVYIEPYNLGFPAVYLDGGNILGWGTIQAGDGDTVTSYLVEVKGSCKIEAKQILGGYGSLSIVTKSGQTSYELDVDVDELDQVYDTCNATGRISINSNKFTSIKLDGHIGTNCYVNGHEFMGTATVEKGTLSLDFHNYMVEDTNLFEVNGGTLKASGRLESFDDTTNTTTGVGFPITQSAGTLVLKEFYAKNAQGGIIFGGGGNLKISNSVMEAGTVGVGTPDEWVYAPAPAGYSVLYTNWSSFNSDKHTNVSETITTTNHTVNASITI